MISNYTDEAALASNDKQDNVDDQILHDGSPTVAGLSLRRNFSWALAGNVTYAACQWIMLMLIAKLGNPQMVGQFSLGLAITAPVFMFSNLQLRSVQATDARGEYQIGDYLGLRFLMSSLALALVIGITLFSGYHQDIATIIIIIGSAKLVESISDILQGFFQLYERMDIIAISQLIKGPLSVVFLGIGLRFMKSLACSCVGMMLAWLFVLLLYELRALQNLRADVHVAGNNLRPLWKKTKLIKLAITALPLGIVTMLVSLNANIPRYCIERIMGQRELGIYAAMAYSMVAGLTVANALGQSAAPKLARYYADTNVKEFLLLVVRLAGIFIVIGVLGILIAVFFGKELITVLFTPEYAQHTDVFIAMAIASAISFLGSILIYALTAARCLVMQIPLYIIITATTFILSIILVPRHGLNGAAYALCCSSIVQLIGAAIVTSSVLIKVKRRVK